MYGRILSAISEGSMNIAILRQDVALTDHDAVPTLPVDFFVRGNLIPVTLQDGFQRPRLVNGRI